MFFFSESMVNFIELSNSRISLVSSFYFSCPAVEEAVLKLLKHRNVIQNHFFLFLEHCFVHVMRYLPELKYSTLEAVFWNDKPCLYWVLEGLKCWIWSITTVVFILNLFWSGNFMFCWGCHLLICCHDLCCIFQTCLRVDTAFRVSVFRLRFRARHFECNSSFKMWAGF